MTFTIPNLASAGYPAQAQIDTGDMAMLTAGIAGNGLLSGGAVTPGTGMQVSVASGSALMAGVTVAFNSATPSVSASDSTHPRLDLVSVNNSGVVSVTTGTPATNPSYPALPANSVMLAALYIPASVTAIISAMITDKRVVVQPQPFVNVKWYGAKGDGTTDDTAAIALAYAALLGGKGCLYFPEGNYYATFPTLNTGQWWKGDGYEATILTLKNGTNADLIQSTNFGSLTGTNSTAGVYSCGIIGMTLDGNKANNSAGRCLSIYGYGYLLQNIRIRNAAADGWYSEWSTSSPSPGADSMEAQVSNFKIHDCGGNGFTFCGPHDSQIDTGIVYSNGTPSAGNTNINFPSTTNQAAGTRVRGVHSWGGNVDYPVVQHDSSIIFEGCEFEGGNVGQFFGDNDVHLFTSRLFTGGSHIAKGIVLGTSPSVQAAHSTIIGCDVIDCIGGVIDMTNAGKYSVIDLHVYQIHHPVNTTSATAVSPGTQDITIAGMASNVLTGMSLAIDSDSPTLAEVVTVNSVNVGASTINCTFANSHSGTYSVANAGIIGGPPDPTNRIAIHQSGASGGLTDETIERLAGLLQITPASVRQVAMRLKLLTAQSANAFEIRNSGNGLLAGFGGGGNLGIGIAPNSTIPLLAQARATGDNTATLVAFAAQTGMALRVQDSSFNNLLQIAAGGNLGIGATPNNSIPLLVQSRADADILMRLQWVDSGQTGNFFELRTDAGSLLTNFGASGNLGIGAAANSGIPLLIAARNTTDNTATLVGIASQTGMALRIQDNTFANLLQISAGGNLGIGVTPLSTTELLAAARNTTDIVAILRAAASQTADLLDFQNSSNTFLSGFGSGGNLGVGIAPNSTIEGLFQARTDTDKPLVVVGHSSTQSSKLLDIQDSTFATLSAFGSKGNLGIGTNPVTTQPLTLQARATTDIISVIKALASQTGDLTEWQDSTGAVLSSIAAGGNLGVGVTPSSTIEGYFQARAVGDVPLKAKGFSTSQTGNLFEADKSDGTSLFALDAYGRVVGNSNSTPTLAAGTGAGTSAPTPQILTGGDMAGTLEWGTGTGSTFNAAQVAVTFGHTYGTAPRAVNVFPTNASASGLKPYVQNVTATGFEVWTNSNPSDSQAVSKYQVGWMVIG